MKGTIILKKKIEWMNRKINKLLREENFFEMGNSWNLYSKKVILCFSKNGSN